MSTTRDAIAQIRETSLSSLVQREIENRILDGDLRAGARVNERALAGELGVSRGPIREACRGLVEAGLLMVIVNRGFFVREITPEEAADVYDVRASLMRLAGETLAPRITDVQLDVLADLVARMDTAQQDGDFERFYALNLEFHDRIVDYADNDRLRAINEGLVKELHLYRRRSLLRGGGVRVANKEHKRILTALQSRNRTRAGLALQRHIFAGKRRFFAATDMQVEAPAQQDRLNRKEKST